MARLDELGEGISKVLKIKAAPEALPLDLVGEGPAETTVLVWAIVNASRRHHAPLDRIRQTDSFIAQTCWIADVQASHGLTRGQSPNRIDPARKAKPCPPAKRVAIERALIHFKMV